MITLLRFARLARLQALFGAALLYALGAGIARYLGFEIHWPLYLLGQAWIALLQLGAHFLDAFYANADDARRAPFSSASGGEREDGLPRNAALLAAAAFFTSTASLTVLFIHFFAASPAVFLFMALIFLGAFFYAAPPLRLAASGYGELTASLLITVLTPGLAFWLQTGEFHRLLAMSAFPLAALHLAMMLALDLPRYAGDIKAERRTLLIRLGWQAGMNLHNALILLAFGLLALAVVLGLPFAIAAPALLVSPFGAMQIWTINRIAAGARPNWRSLTLAAVSLFGAAAFLLTFGFWMR